MDSNMKEMLELAAKAAFSNGGWEWNGVNQRIEVLNDYGHYKKWMPHEDDGDSRRLEVALLLTVMQTVSGVRIEDTRTGRSWFVSLEMTGDRASATRFAVLRAAAKIGRSVP